MADDLAGAVLVELAKRKAARGVRVADAVFGELGFDPYSGGHGTEIARQARALKQTGDFGADLATLVTGVLGHFSHPHDASQVRAAVRWHLGGGHGTLPPDDRP